MKTQKTDNPFRAVRRAGVPICGIETADPAATIKACNAVLNGKSDRVPVLSWDIVNGFRGLNAPGEAYVSSLDGGPCTDPSTAFATACAKLPMEDSEGDNKAGGVIFAHNAHRFIDEPATLQAVWNCRDVFKSAGVSLVLLGPAIKLPLELKNDIPVFPEPVPGEAEIGAVIDSLTSDAGISADKLDRPKVIDGLLGYLSTFAVEQSLALALKADGVDMAQLWKLKVQALKNCAGLEVSLPEVGFSGLSGCAGVKDLISKYLKGRKTPRVVFWLDELEKMIAGGSGGDLSGTTQALLEQFLYWTEAQKVDGILLLGIPGAGKSETCKTTAGEAACPLLRASLSTVKGSLVGQSEAQLKNMLASVDAVAQGRVLMIATCNSLDALTPEVMARFRLATFFYDYPTDEERAALWKFYMKKYELTGDKAPASRNWVGREIASCCERAWLFNCSLEEAAKTVVPVSVANASKMDVLRKSVSGRFLSAAKPGVFTVETQQMPATGRRMEVGV